MATLSRDLRRVLERTVLEARRTAEGGASKALEALGVGHHEPHSGLTPTQRALRNRLRARGRQLGDKRDEKRGTQSIERLIAECAYEHWHRMLFARFLAENTLLIEPESGMDITLGDCQALAREQSRDWLELAAEYAQQMLPQIFRTDDPVLAVALPAETQQALEALLKELSTDIFSADDSLGWVYQFWQSEQKDAVNKSGKKIGAEELPAVTQLFTEDYMVWFLLHNTLGAWWAGKKHPDGVEASSEEDARKAVALPGVTWDYLRLLKGQDGKWRPAAGIFDGWPKKAAEITVLDPCMGSGHFLVFALPMLVAMRMAEEGLTRPAAVSAVLKDNLFGLEIDPRCTQLAAFNLALAAWKLSGYQALSSLNLACSGLAPQAKLADWLELAGENDAHRQGLEELYKLFAQAPSLGSLVDPRREGDLVTTGYNVLKSLLDQALLDEESDEASRELAIAAQGITIAAGLLASRFSLVTTNVPYLGRDKQDDLIRAHCELEYPEAMADLATCFIQRCFAFCSVGGSAALVTPQSWLYQDSFKKMRPPFLTENSINCLARLGPGAFEGISGEVVNVCLVLATRALPEAGQLLFGIDVSEICVTHDKREGLISFSVEQVDQQALLGNPHARISLDALGARTLLSAYASSHLGICTGDYSRFGRVFWELSVLSEGWAPQQTTVDETCPFGGMLNVLRWDRGEGDFVEFLRERLGETGIYQWLRGQGAWKRRGVTVSATGKLSASLYLGDLFDNNVTVIVPGKEQDLTAVWAFCASAQFYDSVRRINQALKITDQSMVEVPFDLEYWQKVAAEKYPDGLPEPHSDDPTQWLFNGHPKGSEQPLQVAVARLLGYRWPRQTGSEFPDCPALDPDGLESHADDDGIVCIPSIKGEDSAADRVRSLLAYAYGNDWNAGQLNQLLKDVGFAGKTLDDWLRDGSFEQHCALFHNRPFIWHVWDGRRDGFQALVNYHSLAEGKGKGRKLLEKLTYAYLGDWIDRQRADQKAGVEGADGRLAAAEHLQAELKNILGGEPPYDIFVRWKPLHQQSIGWEPDINDGVRLNIRPFMTARPLNARGKNACILRVTPKTIKWTKDRGKEPSREKAEFPWFWSWDEETADFTGGKTFDGARWNDLHYTRAVREAARRTSDDDSKRRAH